MNSSTRLLWATRNVSWPTSLTAVPSANSPTSVSCHALVPAFTDCSIASESVVCTPITFTSGRTALM